MAYRNFDELLEAKTIDEQSRLQFTKKWISDNYEITDPAADFIAAVSDVHDHDDLPKHFGQVTLSTAFSSVKVQLLRLPEGWHLGIQRDGQEDPTIVHPKSERSYRVTENYQHVQQLQQLLRNRKQAAPVQQFGVQYEEPVAPRPKTVMTTTPEELASHSGPNPADVPYSFIAGSKQNNVIVDLTPYHS